MVFKVTSRNKVLNNQFLKSSEAAICRCSSKQLFLENSQYSQGKICVRVILIKLQAFKRDLRQVFSCEYCKMFTKGFFDRKPLVASVNLLFLTKSNVGWFLLKRVDLVIVPVIYTLLVETISTHFY